MQDLVFALISFLKRYMSAEWVASVLQLRLPFNLKVLSASHMVSACFWIPSDIICPPIAGPGAELCDSTCDGLYCLQKESYCLPKSCVDSKSLTELAISETNMNCDLERIFLGVPECSGTTVTVKCHGEPKDLCSLCHGPVCQLSCELSAY